VLDAGSTVSSWTLTSRIWAKSSMVLGRGTTWSSSQRTNWRGVIRSFSREIFLLPVFLFAQRYDTLSKGHSHLQPGHCSKAGDRKQTDIDRKDLLDFAYRHSTESKSSSIDFCEVTWRLILSPEVVRREAR
jgi:hypothetical protein